MLPSNAGGAPQGTVRYATPPVMAREQVPQVRPVAGVGMPEVPKVSPWPGYPDRRSALPRPLPWGPYGW